MRDPVVVFLGEFADEKLVWQEIALQFGWGSHRAQTVDALAGLQERFDIRAIFVDCAAANCLSRYLREIREQLPGAKVVVCYPLNSPILSEELVSAGVFHSVPKPLNQSEVRQSIGFAWEASTRVHGLKARTSRTAA